VALNPPYPGSSVPSSVRNFREGCLEFVLERLLHDFANAIGGMLALSDHHLRNDTLEEGIAGSLQLINESAEHCRHLLIAAISALEVGSLEPELFPVSELYAEVQNILKALLPRSVTWESSLPDTDGLVRVPPVEFKQRCLALVSLDLEHGILNQASVTMTYAVQATTCWFSYRTTNQHDSGFAAAAADLLLPLVPAAEFVCCTRDETGFTVEFGLPLEAPT
jgi:hypothetical protein